jgi:hypothetical protein
MRKNIVQLGRLQTIELKTRVSCWIPKAKNTESEHVILIAFPLHQWLQEGASMYKPVLL